MDEIAKRKDFDLFEFFLKCLCQRFQCWRKDRDGFKIQEEVVKLFKDKKNPNEILDYVSELVWPLDESDRKELLGLVMDYAQIYEREQEKKGKEEVCFKLKDLEQEQSLIHYLFKDIIAHTLLGRGIISASRKDMKKLESHGLIFEEVEARDIGDLPLEKRKVIKERSKKF